MFIDKVAREAREAKQVLTSGVKLSTGELEILLFVDYVVLLADSAERLESNLKVLSEVLKQMGAESELEEDESDEGGKTERKLRSENR